MLVRMFAVIDAWLTAKVGTLKPVRPSGAGMLMTGLGLVVILVFTVAPHAVAGYYTIVSHNLLTTVFDDGNGSKPSTTTTHRSTNTSGGSSGSETTETSESTTTTLSLLIGAATAG